MNLDHDNEETKELETIDLEQLESTTGGFIPLAIGIGVGLLAYFGSTSPAR